MKEIDKSEIDKIEKELIRYYRYKNNISKLEKRAEGLKNNIRIIEMDIEECKGVFDPVELEKEKILTYRKYMKTKAKIRQQKSFIEYMDLNIEGLNQERKKLLELQYNKNLYVTEMARRLNMGVSTFYTIKHDTLRNILDFQKMQKGII